MSFIRNPLAPLNTYQILTDVINSLASMQNEFNKHYGRKMPQFIAQTEHTEGYYRVYNIAGTPLESTLCNLLQRIEVQYTMGVASYNSKFCLQIPFNIASHKLLNAQQVENLILQFTQDLNTFQKKCSTPSINLATLQLDPQSKQNPERLFKPGSVRRQTALQTTNSVGAQLPDEKIRNTR